MAGARSRGARHRRTTSLSLLEPRVVPADNRTAAPLLKVGPSPSRWWGTQTLSLDHGETWTEPSRLGHGILGPIKNKPVELTDGTWLSPSSCERTGWKIHIERSMDRGVTWHRGHPINDGRDFAAIQPCILRHVDGRLQLLSRTRQGAIAGCWSTDGVHWSTLCAIALPNPDSGIDAVTVDDGIHILAYNHAQSGRSPLNLAISRDGVHWQALHVLEDDPGEFSYPAIIGGSDGQIHLDLDLESTAHSLRISAYRRVRTGRHRQRPLA